METMHNTAALQQGTNIYMLIINPM